MQLKPPPEHAPKRLRSTEDLRTLQRLMMHALVRPLDARSRMQRKWIDGRSMDEVAGEFIKPNDRLSSFERLEIYNRQYWFRLLDNFYDDNPGLRAALGERKFLRLAEAYLLKYPSASFSLRNLCSRLERFIREEPRWTAPRTALAIDLARFEWAQIDAFDALSFSPLTAEEIAAANPARLKLRLQPHVTLLDLKYPVDDYVLAVKQKSALRNEASNAFDGAPQAARLNRVRVPKPERIFVAVHRQENSLYYKRLEPAAYRILGALRDGSTVARACAAATPARVSAHAAFATSVQEWFKMWLELGWLCRR